MAPKSPCFFRNQPGSLYSKPVLHILQTFCFFSYTDSNILMTAYVPQVERGQHPGFAKRATLLIEGRNDEEQITNNLQLTFSAPVVSIRLPSLFYCFCAAANLALYLTLYLG